MKRPVEITSPILQDPKRLSHPLVTNKADEGAQVAIASPLDLRLQQSLALALQFPYFVTYPCIFVLAYIHKYEYYQVNAICSPRNWD